MKISDTPPFFKATPPILSTPLLLWEKSEPPLWGLVLMCINVNMIVITLSV